MPLVPRKWDPRASSSTFASAATGGAGSRSLQDGKNTSTSGARPRQDRSMVPPRNSKTKKETRLGRWHRLWKFSRQFRSTARRGRARLFGGGGERAAQAQISRRGAHQHLEGARLDRPLVRRLVEEGEGASVERDRHLAALSRLENDAREALELARRPRHARLEVADVD